jgi:hypothetical protein
MNNIQNTKIGITCFEYKGSSYRLSGYCFVYNFSDCNDRVIKSVDIENATHLMGSGVCGVVASIDEITILEETTNWGEEALKDALQSEIRCHERMVKQNERGYDFLKTLPLGLSSVEYAEASDKWVMDGMFD